MIAKASLRHLRTSPQKVRLVVDQIRGRGVEDAMRVLQLSRKGVARDLEKLLKSAVANAEQREDRVDVDDLLVRRAFVDTAPTQKRVRYRAMGRVFRILKRSSHITFELDLRPKARSVGSTDTAPGKKGEAAPAAASKAKAAKPASGKATKKTTSKKKVTKKAVKKESAE